jgi:TfoX/Sxy family transcriptional regulator of competence genes
MGYDEKLGARISEALANRVDVVEKRMFGGIAYMVRGNMCCGIVGDDLMVRVGPEQHDEALARPHTRPMDFAGRPMRGMVYVAPTGIKTAKALAAWVDRGVQHVLTLPPKKEKPKEKRDKKR